MLSYNQSLNIAVSGIVASLSVVLLFFGSIVWILSYLMPMICGLMLIILIQSINKKSAWSVYSSVSILSMTLITDKESALLYIMFFGYYPIIRSSFEKIGNKVARALLKLLFFNSMIILSQIICVYIFMIPFDDFLGKWGIILLLFAANILFVFYEKLLLVLVTIYDKKYKKIINKLLRK